MSPRSYLLTAAALMVLVAVSLNLTRGFAAIVWYWLFAVAACILGVVGAFRIVHGLRAPLWIGVALASPGILWAADHLFRLKSNGPSLVTWMVLFDVATRVAFLAAAVGALRLIEIVSRPHPAFRMGYGLLAAAAILSVVNLVAHVVGWSLMKNTLYAASVRPFFVAVMLVAYGAFIGAAVLLTMRRGIERWPSALISLIGLFLLYESLARMFAVGLRGDAIFWMQPVLMLIGASAVWRIGSVLRAQAISASYAQS